MKYEYQSCLTPYFNEFLKTKRSLGFKYEHIEYSFKEIDIMYLERNIQDPSLTKEFAEEYTEKRPNESNTTRTHRIGHIRTLANFLIAKGIDAYVFPPLPKGSYKIDYVPYIFTDRQLADFFHSIDEEENFVYKTNYCYPIIFRILYSTGMRVNEVLSLKYEDIDFKNATFFIKQSKNNKDRQIPVHPNLLKYLIEYINNHRVYINNHDYIFITKTGNKISSAAVYHYFRKHLWKIGVPHPGRSKGPCVHSFRHTYCVHRLRDWVKAGKDINTLFPYLCAYMGHADTRCTEYYLRLTAELYPMIVSNCEKIFNEG